MMKLKIDLEEQILVMIAREELDLVQFCKYVGIDIMDAFKVFEGRYIPRLESAFKIAKVLKCNVEDLYFLVEKEV